MSKQLKITSFVRNPPPPPPEKTTQTNEERKQSEAKCHRLKIFSCSFDTQTHWQLFYLCNLLLFTWLTDEQPQHYVPDSQHSHVFGNHLMRLILIYHSLHVSSFELTQAFFRVLVVVLFC